jgi:alpha-tubulin suppressor-like RCC1 family protein
MSGNEYGIAIRAGLLFSWGKNIYGECGIGNATQQSSPIPVGAESDWSGLAKLDGQTFSSFALRNGKLFGWGSNAVYQLCDGTYTNRSSPIQIGAETDWSACSVGLDNAYGIRGGKLFSWGDNATYGALGLGDRTTRSSPVQVGAETDWFDIAAQDYGALGIRS